MKNIAKIFVLLALGMSFLSSSATADVFKGGRILGNAMLKGCPMLLADLAGTHSRSQWEQIVKKGTLPQALHQICPKAELKPIPEDEMKDVLDYLEYYSEDGGALPSC